MGILSCIKKIKPALARQDVVLEFKHFLVKDGYMYASDGRIAAGAPLGEDIGHCLIPANDLEKALDLFAASGKEVQLKLTDKNLLLSTDVHKVRIKVLDPQVFAVPEKEDCTRYPVNQDFVEALRIVRPFISANALQLWAAAAYIDGNHIYATNNVCLIAADITDYHFRGSLPVWAVDFILSRPTGLKYISGNNNHLCLEWEDGSWMRSSLIAGEFPAKGLEMLCSIEPAHFKLTAAWRTAYREAVIFCEDQLHIHATKMCSAKDTVDFEVEVDSPTPEELPYSNWNPKFLSAVIDVADAFDPSAYPRPCVFSGSNFRGLVVGRQ